MSAEVRNIIKPNTSRVLLKPHNSADKSEFVKLLNSDTKEKRRKNVALVSSVFSIGAVMAALLALSRVKNTKMFDINLKEGDVLILGTSTVAGATLGGMLADDKKNRKAKMREAIHQIIGNIATPLAVLYVLNRGVDKLNINIPKIKSTAKIAKYANFALEILPSFLTSCAGLWAGVNLGNKISNVVNTKIFGENNVKRDVKTKDYCIHIDDPLTAITLADKTGKLKAFTGKIMPFVFMLSGYEAAMAEKQQ